MNLATVSSSLREGILQLRRNAIASKRLLAPFCIVRNEDHTILPILNILSEPVVLPQGFAAALFRTDISIDVVAALNSSSVHAPVESVPLSNSDIDHMILETLCNSER